MSIVSPVGMTGFEPLTIKITSSFSFLENLLIFLPIHLFLSFISISSRLTFSGPCLLYTSIKDRINNNNQNNPTENNNENPTENNNNQDNKSENNNENSTENKPVSNNDKIKPNEKIISKDKSKMNSKRSDKKSDKE